MARKFSNTIKSLLHFDFPYFAEANDGLRDEISNEVWKRNGTVKFVGTEKPNDAVISGTPKFGYRCPSFASASDFLSCTNTSGIFSLSQTGNYEIEFFLRVTSNTAGRIFALKNSNSYTLSLSLLSDGKLSLAGVTSTQAITLNTWAHILTRITGGKIYLYLNGTQIISGDFPGAACNSFELGGFVGQIDEFILRHTAFSGVNVPTAPYQGYLPINDIGGFGNSRHGTQTISAACVFNSYGAISSATGNKITVSSWHNGKFGAPAAGDEVMIHVTLSKGTNFNDLGKYAFRKITAISGNTITLDSAITDFNVANLVSAYYLQVITVPNFANLTVNANVTISPKSYADNCGGLIAFRVAGTFTHNGLIISSGYGPVRTDTLQLTHAGIITNFILNSGGGIFIAAKTFKASSTSRIGAAWDGSAKAGTYNAQNNGNPGGAGYGGAGGSDTDTNCTGGNGGVGGGGGGQDGGGTNWSKTNKGFDAGASGNAQTTGGGYSVESVLRDNRIGGTQGKNPNGISGAGGGAGGNGTNENGGKIPSGANVIIIAEKFSADASAISTGGAGGNKANGTEQGGGGGTGFCYIAAKEMI